MRYLMICFVGYLLAASAIAAETLPNFGSFSVDTIYRGSLTRPLLDSPRARGFQTRLIAGAREQPNFAGRFHLITWGCGTSCSEGAIVDAASGKVTFLPFSICCYDGRMDAPGWDSIQFERSSSLIVFHGQRNEEGINGDHYYAFDMGEFRFLATKEVKEQSGSANSDAGTTTSDASIAPSSPNAQSPADAPPR